jgi:hypothetical protein
VARPAVADSPPPATGQQAALASLLVNSVEGVVAAQRALDRDALGRVTGFVGTPHGELALPPLWYTFQQVRLTLEMTASVTRLAPRSAGSNDVRLDCRLVNPAAVSLFGYAAASGLKVELTLGPVDAGGLRPSPPDPPVAPVAPG